MIHHSRGKDLNHVSLSALWESCLLTEGLVGTTSKYQLQWLGAGRGAEGAGKWRCLLEDVNERHSKQGKGTKTPGEQREEMGRNRKKNYAICHNAKKRVIFKGVVLLP